MMKDPGRGWAWTRALLGVVANEVHICGEEGAVDLVKGLMTTTGEDVQVLYIEVDIIIIFLLVSILFFFIRFTGINV